MSGFVDELFDSIVPVAGLPFHVHDSNDPNMIRFVDEDDRVREIVAEMSPGRWIKFPKPCGICGNFIKQTLHLAIETHAEIR